MYLTVHSASALVIAKFIPNPLLAFLVGLASHFVLDFVPHGDEHLIASHFPYGKTIRRLFAATIIDGIIMSLLLLVYVATTPLVNYTILVASLIGAILPDLLHAIYVLVKPGWLKWIYNWHSKIHNLPGHKLNWTQGMLIQCMALAALWLLVM